MAKKFGKFLLFTAAIGSAAAAAYYYFRKKDAEDALFEDEDYDDFSDELEEETESKNYVPLTPNAEQEENDSFVPLNQVAQNVEDKEAAESGKSEPEVEEFFDEEDDSAEEPVISDN